MSNDSSEDSPPRDLPPSYENTRNIDILFEHSEEARNNESTAFLAGSGDDQDHDDDVDNLDLEDEERELRSEMETFEVLEPNFDSNSIYSRMTLSSQRLARKFNHRVIYPVQHILVDPVVALWRNICEKFDQFLSRFGNPLMFKRILYLFMVGSAIFAAISFGIFPSGTADGEFSVQFHSHHAVRERIKHLIDLENMKQRSRYLSSMAHMPGTSGDNALKNYIRDSFASYGLRPVSEQPVQSFVSFPNSTEDSMVLRFVDNRFNAKLWESQAYSDGDQSGSHKQPRPFLGLAAKGEAEGPLVYVNYGTEEDLKILQNMGVSLKNSIVLMKYGKMETGLKVLLAEKAGAKGAILFSNHISKDGKGLPENGVMRGHVGISAISPGDILTPGWSQAMSPQILEYSMVKSIPKIPAIPVSWTNVKPFVESLKNHGKSVPEEWAEDEKVFGISEWWTGDENSPRVYIKNDPIQSDRQELWNIIAKIPGSEDANKAVIIGAHRDSFCFGNSDSTSGTVTLMEVARILSLLNRNFGWVPLRSIYFASWDGTSENIIGSTEWAETNSDELRQEGLIYLNLDQAISGNHLDIKGHPALIDLVDETLGYVNQPYDNNKTLSDNWSKEIGLLGVGGDWMAFQSLAGIVSLDVKFNNPDPSASIPHYSCFDTYEWLTSQVDPDFQYHRALTEIIAYLTLSYSDAPLLPINYGSYGDMIHRYSRDLARYAKSIDEYRDQVNFDHLISAGDVVIQAGVAYRDWWANWHALVLQGETPPLSLHRQGWNSKVAALDKELLDMNGIPDRNWFKHVIYGPQLYHPTEGDYMWSTFPGVRDALKNKDWKLAQEEVERAAKLISDAAYEMYR